MDCTETGETIGTIRCPNGKARDSNPRRILRGGELRLRPARSHVETAPDIYQDIDDTINGVAYKIVANPALVGIPKPSPGDTFFDFEGDPLWQDPATGEWGIEYLFDVVEHSSDGHDFVAFPAHSLEEERQALIDFVDHVNERRALYPDLHVFHYAQYGAPPCGRWPAAIRSWWTTWNSSSKPG